MRRFTIACLLLTGLLLTSRAEAVPIGTFSWSDDPLFGPIFTVENFSHDPLVSLGPPGAAFSEIFVDLAFGDGTAPTSLSLAHVVDPADTTIDPGEVAQNFLLPPSVAIASAGLRLVFPLAGTVALLDAQGVPLAALASAGTSGQIDFTAADVTPIPEPETLVLLAVALLTLRLRHRVMRLRPERERGWGPASSERS